MYLEYDHTSKQFTSCVQHCQGLHKGLLLWSETDTGDDLLPDLCQVISRSISDLLFI